MHVRVKAILKRQLDTQTDTVPISLMRPRVHCLHETRAATSDNRMTRPSKTLPDCFTKRIPFMAWLHPGGTEHADRRPKIPKLRETGSEIIIDALQTSQSDSVNRWESRIIQWGHGRVKSRIEIRDQKNIRHSFHHSYEKH
jgi:hypothetical protein